MVAAIERGFRATLKGWRCPPALINRLAVELRQHAERDPIPATLYLVLTPSGQPAIVAEFSADALSLPIARWCDAWQAELRAALRDAASPTRLQ